MWPLDGGKYLGTGTAVITEDPDTGRVNVGTYRQMIKSSNELGLYTSPGKDAGLDLAKWWGMGKPMPVAMCYGIAPLLFVVAATGGIAAYKIPELVRALRKAGHEVRCAMIVHDPSFAYFGW